MLSIGFNHTTTPHLLVLCICLHTFVLNKGWSRGVRDHFFQFETETETWETQSQGWDWDWDLWHLVSKVETETETFTFGLKSWDWDWDFYLWSQILRLRLFILVSNIETGTETLLQSSVFSGTYVASSSFIGRFYQDHLWTNP